MCNIPCELCGDADECELCKKIGEKICSVKIVHI